MAEYKDVELLKNQIADFKRAVNSVKPMNSDYITGYISALSVIEGAIADQPIAGVVEVVRCKDCKYLFQDLSEREFHFCVRNLDYFGSKAVNLDDFCSFGRRKELDNG